MADYVRRLGINSTPLVEELTETTASCAYYRFEHYLRTRQPQVWHAHVDAYVSERLDPRRREHLRRFEF